MRSPAIRRALPLLVLGLLGHILPSAGVLAQGAAENSVPVEFDSTPAAGVEITQIVVGLDNTWKLGFWTPVRIGVRCERATRGWLTLVAPDGDGTMVRHVAELPWDAPAGESQLWRFVKLGRADGELSIEWSPAVAEAPVAGTTAPVEDDHRETLASISLERTKSIPATQVWMVGYGDDVGLAASGSREQRQRTTITQLGRAEQMPDRWQGLEGVDVLAITTAGGEVDGLEPAQKDAILEWTRLGGHTVLSCGARGGDVLRDRWWRSLAPGDGDGVVRMNSADGLERLATARERLTDYELAVVKYPEDRRRVLASVIGPGGVVYPAVIRRGYGMGMVTFVAVDLDQPPVSTWSGRAALTAAVAGEQETREQVEDESTVGELRHTGYSDLSGQLRSAIDLFPHAPGRRGVPVMAFSLVVTMLVAYLLLLGPADYLLLRRLDRPWLAWVTLPLLIVATGWGITRLTRWIKPTEPRLNQATIIDVDVREGLIRGTAWAQLYAPYAQTLDIEAQASPALLRPAGSAELPLGMPARGMLLSWQGLPGASLGGMQGAPLGAMLGTAPYDLRATPASGGGLRAVPMQPAATRSLSVRWWDYSPQAEAADCRLWDSDGLLQGSFANPVDVELEDTVLLYGSWIYLREGGRLRPGETIAVDTLRRRDSAWRLTRKRVHAEKTTYTTTPWDPGTREVGRVLEMIMFHELAGGRNYTRLHNRYQAYLDASEQVTSGDAVLVGRAVDPALRIRCGGESPQGDQWTFYRLVLPVLAALPASADPPPESRPQESAPPDTAPPDTAPPGTAPSEPPPADAPSSAPSSSASSESTP